MLSLVMEDKWRDFGGGESLKGGKDLRDSATAPSKPDQEKVVPSPPAVLAGTARHLMNSSSST